MAKAVAFTLDALTELRSFLHSVGASGVPRWELAVTLPIAFLMGALLGLGL